MTVSGIGVGIRGAVRDAVAAGLMDIRKEIDVNAMARRQDLFFEFHVSCYSRPWPLEPMCRQAAVPGDRDDSEVAALAVEMRPGRLTRAWKGS